MSKVHHHMELIRICGWDCVSSKSHCCPLQKSGYLMIHFYMLRKRNCSLTHLGVTKTPTGSRSVSYVIFGTYHWWPRAPAEEPSSGEYSKHNHMKWDYVAVEVMVWFQYRDSWNTEIQRVYFCESFRAEFRESISYHLQDTRIDDQWSWLVSLKRGSLLIALS